MQILMLMYFEADVGKLHYNELNNQCAYINSNSELSVVVEHLDTSPTLEL